jgi:hypothetical protein
VRRDGEHGSRLREMRARKAALQNPGAVGTELSLGVPPALRIHLAASGDDDTHPQQPVEVQLPVYVHLSPSRSTLAHVTPTIARHGVAVGHWYGC